MLDEKDNARTHIKIFANDQQASDLSRQIKDTDMVHIICALSGG